MSNTSKPRLADRIGEYGWIWIGTVLLFVISWAIAPGSMSKGALLAMLPFAGMLAIVAVGHTVVIQQRGLDMSAAGSIALGGMVVSMLAAKGWPLAIALLGGTGAGMLAGLVNGLLVTRFSITPIVTTLAMGAVLTGLVRQISHGTPIAAPQALKAFSTQRIAGLPYSLLLAVLFIIVVAVITRKTKFGRRFVAVGVNPASAASAGIDAERYQVGSYVIAGLSFSIAGMLFAGYIGNASHIAGADYLLPGIAAVVVGGTPFTGGRGSVIASGVAALFMTQLGQMVLSMGASNATQLFVQAGAIILAVGLRTADFSALRSRSA